MKNALTKAFCFVLSLCLMLSGIVLAEDSETGSNVMAGLSDTQRNSVGLLNYLSYLTKEIHVQKNNRLYIDEAYSSLFNNTYMNAIDLTTKDQMLELLDTLNDLKMLSVKRDRIQYIYEQKQAQEITALIPSPLSVHNVIETFKTTIKNAKSLNFIAIIDGALETVAKYEEEKEKNKNEYLQAGWELEDSEMELLHNSHASFFNYMWQIIHDYNLPDDLALKEPDLDRFIEWKHNDNLIARIQFLESNQNVYQGFGEYWLLLAETYYQNGDYDKCLQTVSYYENYSTRIFRKDYHYGKVLPMAITAAGSVLDGSQYCDTVARYADRILANCDPEEWTLRFYAACTYMELAERTKDQNWYEKAYDVILNNVLYLVKEQISKNKAYLSAIKNISVPDGTTSSKKKEINDYNNGIKEERKTEMPPVSSSLTLNCELLFSLADTLQVSDAEREKINGILYGQGDLFLNGTMNSLYGDAQNTPLSAVDIEISFDGKDIKLPTMVLTESATISVGVLNASTGTVTNLDDWVIKSVDRVNPADPSTFVTTFHSKTAESISYAEGSTAWVNLNVTGTDQSPVLNFNFVAYSKVDFLIPYITFKLAE